MMTLIVFNDSDLVWLSMPATVPDAAELSNPQVGLPWLHEQLSWFLCTRTRLFTSHETWNGHWHRWDIGTPRQTFNAYLYVTTPDFTSAGWQSVIITLKAKLTQED